MIKRVVISAPARGYVDGRFIGEEKEPRDGTGARGRRGKSNANADSILGSVAGVGRGGKGRSEGRGQGKPRGAGGAAADNIGNTTAKRRGRNNQGPRQGQGQGQQGQGQGQSRGQSRAGAGAGNAIAGVAGGLGGQAPRGRGRRPAGGGQVAGQGNGQGAAQGQRQDGRQGKRRSQNQPRGEGAAVGQNLLAGGISVGMAGTDGRPPMRKSRGGKKTPFRSSQRTPQSQHGQHNQQQMMSPTQSADIRRLGDESKSGQFAEALAASANIKRERLHKVLAQSGHGSRRDMEILISSGRLMVNGIVATAGTQVAPGDNVLLDLRPIKLKFSEDLPRVLLYHKPEGEIVTTSDPGNRITVFDNLPRVENGKWVAIGRLDINTSGLLIFTTSGELANRFMHPRYEVEREYAVRILGELTEEQGKRLLEGIVIESDDAKSAGRDEHHDDFDHDVDFAHLAHLGHDDDHGMVDIHDEPEAQPVQLSEDEQANDMDGDMEGDMDGDIFNREVVTAPIAKAVVAKPATPLRDGLARFDSIEKRGGEGVNQWYHVVIKEGRNREVRKMFEALGLTVSRLIRIRFGKVELPPRLARGKMMELEAAQVKSVLTSAGMAVEGGTAPLPSGARQDRPQHKRGSRGEQGQRGNGAKGAKGAKEGRTENKTREPRQARETRRPRDFAASGGVSTPEQTQVDENGQPIISAQPGLDAEGQAITRPDGQRDGRNKRRSRGGRGARNGRGGREGQGGDRQSPLGENNSANDAGIDGRTFSAQIANDSSGASSGHGDNVGNQTQSPDGMPRASNGKTNGETNPNANRGRSRRNLRTRAPRAPRAPGAENVGRTERSESTGNADRTENAGNAGNSESSTPPKENNGNQ